MKDPRLFPKVKADKHPKTLSQSELTSHSASFSKSNHQLKHPIKLFNSPSSVLKLRMDGPAYSHPSQTISSNSTTLLFLLYHAALQSRRSYGGRQEQTHHNIWHEIPVLFAFKRHKRRTIDPLHERVFPWSKTIRSCLDCQRRMMCTDENQLWRSTVQPGSVSLFSVAQLGKSRWISWALYVLACETPEVQPL